MTDIELQEAPRNASSGYRVDVSRGDRDGRVSSEWFSRPDDQRYLSLPALQAAVKTRAERSRTRIVESAAIRVEASREDPEALTLIVPGADVPIAPTHWSFGQLTSLVGAPATYLRQIPAALAGINLQYGLTSHRAEQVKMLETEGGRTELRAVTGPDYGRIYDHELVSAVQRIAGDGVGDTRWKVPGVLDWSTGVYNPNVDVTKDTTTLYASDRDVFLFLVDDRNPIEAGTLPDGSPDLYFRGFYCWNSEVGAKTLGIASFYLRAVCQNRNLWGVEDFQEIRIRHSKHAANRFAHEAAPALTRFADSSPALFVEGIRAARERIVARTDEDRTDFLRKRGFSKAETGRIVETVLAEEGRPPESVFDFVQGITAVSVYLDPGIMDALTAYADKRDRSLSLVAEAAIASFVTPDASERLEAALSARLDRLNRSQDRLERDQTIALETLALFVRHWLTVMPSLPEAQRHAAQAKGGERYDAFVEALGRRLAKGSVFRREIAEELGAGPEEVDD